MKEEFAYKVVIKKNEKLLSGWIHNLRQLKSATVEYKINAYVRNKIGTGPLGTFKTLSDAINFKNDFCHNGLIYKCKIQKSKFSCFWDKEKNDAFGVSGTIYARSVKLLKRVN
jgi:hypothetical protein